MHWLVGWSWIGAALFGVLIAATDPVSVIAAFREMRCQPRVSMVVESESLLNDGVAAVGFAVLSAVAAGRIADAGERRPAFLWTLGGGVLIGLAVSGAILLIAGRTNDPLVEITLTTHRGLRLVPHRRTFPRLGHHQRAHRRPDGRQRRLMASRSPTKGATACRWAWEYFAFLANSFVFILIGMNVGDPAAAPARLVAGGGRDPARARRPRAVDLSARAAVQPVALEAARRLTSTPCSGAGCAARSRWRLRLPSRRACRSATRSSSPPSSSSPSRSSSRA